MHCDRDRVGLGRHVEPGQSAWATPRSTSLVPPINCLAPERTATGSGGEPAAAAVRLERTVNPGISQIEALDAK